MEHRKMFESMTPEARKFYMRVINTAVLNLHAVRAGLFDTLLCETDDPRVSLRWKTSLPNIIETMEELRLRALEDDANKKAGEGPST
jgi:hypothetical protein